MPIPHAWRNAAGFRAIYLSGGGVAVASLGVPDLGISTLDDVLTDVRRITDATELPLLVDADTGFGASAFNIARTVKSLIKSGAGAMHIEDQVQAKRCGHRPGKAIVSEAEMVDRIKAAVDARTDPEFVIMARTDALAAEGVQSAIERACRLCGGGRGYDLSRSGDRAGHIPEVCRSGKVPILANITEFGVTPLYTVEELAQADVAMALYPLSAFRAMSAAALNVYRTIRTEGSQKNVIAAMQTRAELYDFLDYHAYEEKLNKLFSEPSRKPENE